ncbi:MAG TPA: alanine/ornithine racemase family PLP-dependent enzyme [Methanomicrobia archaeon]|nr:alanine/ornithine racemase family PLP-dependent enzyme [Methanomicrobia archaeon]
MATLNIYPERIISNIEKLQDYLTRHGKSWTLVTKVLSGHKKTLEALINHDVFTHIHSVGDARISSLRTIKDVNPSVKTMYIKPPELRYVKQVVKYADYSLNTSLDTIRALNEEARQQGKTHRVGIMIELGELREGILGETVTDFYEKVFQMSNIEVCGLGTNLGCMFGVEPTRDKLVQLCLYQRLIEAKYDQYLGIVSGGSSITLPFLKLKKVPACINHFRIGEAAFCGTSPFDNKRFAKLSTSTFEFTADIIELYKKEVTPDGIINEGNVGHVAPVEDDSGTEKAYKAILDFGMLDVDHSSLQPKNKDLSFVGISSDMAVYDIGKNEKSVRVGDKITFNPTYLAVAKLMHSKFIAKNIMSR